MGYTVYKITNSVNNKLYFGVTQQSLIKRWQQHKCNSNKKSYHLYNAIKKYGFEKFTIEVVFNCKTKEEMFSKEKELIYKYKTNDNNFGYNNSLGGESSRYGCKLTEEQKAKISLYQKNRNRTPHSEETKIKIGLANKKNKISEQHKRKISEKLKGRTPWNKGIKQTDYVKKRT